MTQPPYSELPPRPALLVDAQLRLLQCNAAARVVLAANAEVLHLEQGRLSAPRQPAALGERVRRALQLAALRAPQALALARPGRFPLTLLLQAQASPLSVDVLVLLTDPYACRIDRHILQSLFELTRTESRVAVALAEGRGTDQIANELGVQLNTVQVHVKRLLAKTGMARQSQLVSMIWRSAAVLAPATTATEARPGQDRTPAARGDGGRLPSALTCSGNDG